MKDCHQVLIKWLNNAYGMEHSIVEVLEKHAKAAGDMPEIQAEIEGHITQTKDQADKVKAEIERLGGDVSEIKEWSGKAMGWLQGMASNLSDDKLVNNAIMEHATEHFEMATYQTILKAAEICGEDETAQMAKKIMQQETDMGEKLKQKLGKVVEYYMMEEKKD